MAAPTSGMIRWVRGTGVDGNTNPPGNSGLGNGAEYRTGALRETPSGSSEDVRTVNAFFESVSRGQRISPEFVRAAGESLRHLSDAYIKDRNNAGAGIDVDAARRGFEEDFGKAFKDYAADMAAQDRAVAPRTERLQEGTGQPHHRLPGARDPIVISGGLDVSENGPPMIPEGAGGRRSR